MKARTVILASLLVLIYVAILTAFIYGTSGESGVDGFFHWPEGSIWSNLLASALLAAGFIWRTAVHQRELLAQARAHHATMLAENIKTREHAEALHRSMRHHIVDTVNPLPPATPTEGDPTL